MRRETKPMFEVATRHEDSQRYESLSKQVASDAVDGFVREAIRELREQHAEAGRPFSIYTGCDQDDEQLVEVCLPTEEGSKTLPGGEIAFTTVRGEQCEYPAILSAYDAVFGYARSLGLSVAGAPREIYIADFETAESPELQIAVPLVPRRVWWNVARRRGAMVVPRQGRREPPYPVRYGGD